MHFVKINVGGICALPICRITGLLGLLLVISISITPAHTCCNSEQVEATYLFKFFVEVKMENREREIRKKRQDKLESRRKFGW